MGTRQTGPRLLEEANCGLTRGYPRLLAVWRGLARLEPQGKNAQKQTKKTKKSRLGLGLGAERGRKCLRAWKWLYRG